MVEAIGCWRALLQGQDNLSTLFLWFLASISLTEALLGEEMKMKIFVCKQYMTTWIFSRGLWTWPPWVICASAFNHKIGNAAHSGVSGVLFFTKPYKWNKQRWKNGHLERNSARQCDFEDLQRCANSRWLTDGSDHNRNYDLSMWLDNDLSILCYFLATFP